MNPRGAVNPDPRRALPGVDRLVREVSAAHPELPEWAVKAAARALLGEARDRLKRRADAAGAPDAAAGWPALAAARAAALAAPHPRRVVNATGVVLHTNLGRAPLAQGAAAAAARAASGYSDLELDLASGRRGDRLARTAGKLAQLAGAEAALACNNNAAAVLLALNTLARGRQVVVSRGELVEIGGSFRVPEIMERAGVLLVEVGTTNRTHPRDYERAIGPETALLLKVHRSNFEQRGFVREVGLDELAAIGRARGLPVVEDLGSGTLVDLRERGLPAEAYAPARLEAGADLVCLSGDKLLGGPQAGIVLGRRELLEPMRRNPLARALRLDKMTVAALDWTLDALLSGRAEEELPALRMLLEPLDRLEERAGRLADRLRKRLPDARIELVRERAPVGGGSLPGFEIESCAVAVRPRAGGASGASRLAARLRGAPVPVVARIRDDAVLLDLRTLGEEELELVEEAASAPSEHEPR
jgi:L-seryl-tRNA(Ser) seleniumtransferase